MKGKSLIVMLIGISMIGAIALSGCGAMFKGTSQMISLNSDPPRATAIVKSSKGVETQVTTPTSITVKKSGTYSIDFRKEGYVPTTVVLNRHLNGGMLTCDILWLFVTWIPVAIVVDAVTGGWYEFTPETINVALEPEKVQEGQPPKGPSPGM